MGNCIVPACGKPVKAKKMCAMHHQRWLRHGDPAVIKVRQAAEPTACKWVNCGRFSVTKGYCSKHYYIQRLQQPQTKLQEV
ncbi:hypothetical protein GXP70_03915 [Paenibacillus lycopersici]|uniref:Uncharacterized protein n=1 Tax=Paenibacillus lycopersici TaxID=2704462 RepID=A0A6C0FPY9_9BACL|nr:hypothetical protein [Paenibacillus lycopersici]QHT59198.1 hypothetical protein GXP70_03915 [Paenibacillus lycopersici]